MMNSTTKNIMKFTCIVIAVIGVLLSGTYWCNRDYSDPDAYEPYKTSTIDQYSVTYATDASVDSYSYQATEEDVQTCTEAESTEYDNSSVEDSDEYVRSLGYNACCELPPDNLILDEYELDLFATVVYLEAGSASYECQLAVASVIYNNMVAREQSLEEVVYAPNQFSVIYDIPYSDPSEYSISAVEEVLTYGPTLPPYVLYFRADHYHNWDDGWVVDTIGDYTCIDNVYFSYDVYYKESLGYGF